MTNPNRTTAINQSAKSVFMIANGKQQNNTPDLLKNPVAVTIGEIDSLKAGKVKAEKLFTRKKK